MKPEEKIKEVKWYDKRLLIRSVVMGVVFFSLLYTWAMRSKPPEGFVFERVPAITGIYKCCEAGGRYSQSWVGGFAVNCRGFSYFHLGTGRNDCGFKEELGGHPVLVEQVLVPAYDGPLPLVSKITSHSQTFYALDDQRIRELWIFGTTNNSVTIAFILAVILHGAQLIYLNRNLKKPEGK